MTKSYFNSMIIGNSAMLGCIDGKGELIRLFWPNIDFPQHIDRLTVGITCPQLRQGAIWLKSEEWRTEQYYLEDTNIAVTAYLNDKICLKVTQTDFALPDRAVLARCYEVENMGDSSIDTGFVAYSSSVSTIPHTAGILYEQNLSALIHYKHNYYYSLSSTIKANGYQLGANAEQNAEKGRLQGNDVIGMMKEGALQWEAGALAAGGRLRFVLYICVAQDLKALKILTREAACQDPLKALEQTTAYWRNCLNGLRQVRTGKPDVDALYRRSLLVFALMSDKKTGALLAAPEPDEEFTRCGRYAYCWGRDAAFIAAALDKVGMHAEVESFYRWAASVQDEDGSWQQRYHMDGNLAPSWGMQIDECGSILAGILKHYEACGDKSLLAELWPCVKKGVEFLAGYIDKETGLPWLSFDLWEERLGEHAYSAAAVCAGMEAGAKIAEVIADGAAGDGLQAGYPAGVSENVAAGVPETAAGVLENPDGLRELAAAWYKAAAKMRDALQANFWHSGWNRFVRSVRVKLNGWGEELTDAKVWLKLNENGIARDYSMLDGTLDISLLGLCIPFGLYPADDPRMEATAKVVEQVLAVSPAGGIMRYEYDGYIGGNPWIIATLWAALYQIEKKSFDKAREYFYWAIKGATEQGLLPEQVDRESGKPAWVIPLTWSHAMFILVLDGLLGAGEL